MAEHVAMSPLQATAYGRVVSLVAPRILGLMDRDAESSTYGCCERYYWHYKLHDYPNIRFQETCSLLALLFAGGLEHSPYTGAPRVLDWSLAAVDFWLARRHKDGSAAEMYPFERSLCGTAFSTMAVTEALWTLLGTEAATSVQLWMEQKDFLGQLRKTGLWLAENVRPEVSNQLAAATCALHNAARLTKETRLAAAAEECVAQLRSVFDTRGHLPEYGGFDLGYATISASCLAYCADRMEVAGSVHALVADICAACEPAVGPRGGYDNTGMSRGTSYLYPFGFALVDSGVLDRLAAGIDCNEVLSPLWMDDRYCIALAVDYLRTHMRLAAACGVPGKEEQA